MAKPELRDHRKFLKLRRLLGEPTPHVLGYLECLWTRGYQTGEPVIGDALDVEAAAEYPGEANKFSAAALAAGFLDDNGDGTFSIHNLYQHAPKYAKQRMLRLGTAPKTPSNDEYECDVIDPEQDVCGTDLPVLGQNGQECATEPKPRTENLNPKEEEDPPAPRRVAVVFNPLAAPLPFDSPSFRLAWGEWVDYRRQTGKKLTEASVSKQLKFLSDMREADAVGCIDTAIRNSWQGLFLDRYSSGKRAPPTKGSALESDAARHAMTAFGVKK